MPDKKHIHLIGICGTAMASLAGLLQLAGSPRHRLGSGGLSAHVRSAPRSSASPSPSRSAEANLQPPPDLIVVGNAISRGNPEVEFMLDQRIPFTSLARMIHDEFISRSRVAGRRRHARQDHHHQHAGLDLRSRRRVASRSRPILPHRRRRRKLRHQLPPRHRPRPSSSRATSTTPPSSTRARSSCTTFPMR